MVAGRYSRVMPSPVKAPRPEVLTGRTYCQRTGCGKVYVTVNRDADGNVFELFIRAAKAGGCMAAQTETIGRLVSWQARHGLDVSGLPHYIKGISCKERLGKEGAQSCADAIARVLEQDEADQPVKAPEVIFKLLQEVLDDGRIEFQSVDPWFSVG